MQDSTQKPILIVPNGEKRVLLHCCCAPCSCSIIERMVHSGIEPTIFFYNPNIYPREEYEIRKQEVIRFVRKHGVIFVDADYDSKNWFAAVNGLEQEPEKGRRCTVCFDMRLGHAGLYAHQNGFKVFTSSLSISRHKNMDQVHESGLRAASRFPGISYWTYNWRKECGLERSEKITREEGFYRQKYCGCVYSMRSA